MKHRPIDWFRLFPLRVKHVYRAWRNTSQSEDVTERDVEIAKGIEKEYFVSTCCNAPVYTDGEPDFPGDYSCCTVCYMCSKCGCACDVKVREKTAIDQLTNLMAAGAWQDGPAPKDGSWILGLFRGLPYVVAYDSWEVGGDEESPPDGTEEGWCLAGDRMQVMDQDEPYKWARIIHPNRHMQASWDVTTEKPNRGCGH
jgi:hypothetical protein